MTWAASDEALNWQEVMLGVLTWLPWAQLIVGVHRMFYCDSSDYSSNDNGDQYMAARQRAALEEVFNQYKARFFHPFTCVFRSSCEDLQCACTSSGPCIPCTGEVTPRSPYVCTPNSAMTESLLYVLQIDAMFYGHEHVSLRRFNKHIQLCCL